MKNWALGRAAVSVILAAAMVLSGCSSNWVTEAREIVAMLIPAATNMATLAATLQGTSVSSEEAALVESAGKEASADLQFIAAFLAAYEAADETGKEGILNEIQNVLAALQGNLQGVIVGLHVKDPAVQSKVAAVVGILLAEVQSLAAIVPVIRGEATGSRAHGAALPRPSIRKTPLRSGEFVKSYNSVLKARSGNAELDRITPGLQIH